MRLGEEEMAEEEMAFERAMLDESAMFLTSTGEAQAGRW
jgi:hypothetical protein